MKQKQKYEYCIYYYLKSICMGWLMQDPDCYLSFDQEPMG